MAMSTMYVLLIDRLEKTNCLTEIFVERALARAAEVDKYLAEHMEPMGPLHGLPISLKDQFTIRGLETINGQSF